MHNLNTGNVDAPRRAKFQTQAVTSDAEKATFLSSDWVRAKVEKDDPTVDIPIESIFAFSRIKRPISWWHIIFFTLWTPIGLVVLVARAVVMFGFLGSFHYMGSTNTPGFKHFHAWVRPHVPFIFMNIICPFCGLIHTVRGKENINAVLVDKCIFVSNHITSFDPLCKCLTPKPGEGERERRRRKREAVIGGRRRGEHT
jgi:hypothetical protein